MRNYTQADREKIFELHVKHKMNYSQIAKRFGVTKNAIAGLMYRFVRSKKN